MRTLREGLPPRCFLVIGSSSPSDIPITRLRALRQLAEVDSDDLCFSQSEAAELFQHKFGVGLPVESMNRLVDKTKD